MVRSSAPHTCIIFDTTDLHYLRAFRGAKVTGNLNLLRQALELQRAELAAVRRADATLVVSSVEQEILARECPGARVSIVSNIHPIQGSAGSFGAREGIVFIGAFPHHPNQDAMRYFMAEIYPLVKARHPSVPITIIGSEPPAWLVAAASDTVTVTGHVADLDAYLNRCRLTIAPLRYGAGVKGKVLTSMSYGVPVVASSIAIEGIPAQDRREVLIADEPVGFSNALHELYTDAALWSALSMNGLEMVRENFSAAAARDALAQLFLALRQRRVEGIP
jgi:glycosyltransferase involved in cell wall biosynthesis